jgi:hypothetical protein
MSQKNHGIWSWGFSTVDPWRDQVQNVGDFSENYGGKPLNPISMGDLQDPFEWRYVSTIYIRPYFGGISVCIGLT